MGLLLPFTSHKKNSHCDGSIVFFYGCWIKHFLQKLARVLWSLICKNMARPLFIFNVMFMVGYFNELTLSVKYNLNKLLRNKLTILSAHRADSFYIIAFHPVKNVLGINPMGIRSPWDNSFEIIILKPVKTYF